VIRKLHHRRPPEPPLETVRLRVTFEYQVEPEWFAKDYEKLALYEALRKIRNVKRLRLEVIK
jgi:hypothetical protein